MQASLQPAATGARQRDRLLSRRYVWPFLLACVVLAFTQATGINSVLAYAVNILQQAGLPGAVANGADVAIKLLNAVMTVVALVLVDRKGRKFLLMLGTGGIMVALVCTGLLFLQVERGRDDVHVALQRQVSGDALALRLDAAQWRELGVDDVDRPQQLTVSYRYGGFSNVRSVRSDAPGGELVLRREDNVQADSVIGAFFRRLHLNPFADPAVAAHAPLEIERASLGPVPPPAHGWAVAACILRVRRVLRSGPGRMRVAGALGADAHAHPLQRHEHRAADQPVRVDGDRGDLPAHRRPPRLCEHVLLLGRLHPGVLPRRRVPAAGDTG